jgi:hypothetical protein
VSARVRALAAACMVTVLTGCGGSGAAGDGGSWGQRADEVCDRTERSLRAIAPPEDVGDLDRVMVRVSEQVRAAIGELRELEISGEEKRRAKPFLDDLALVERSLDRIADATSAGERRPIEKAARSLRLDAVDLAAHAEEAGLTRCGREDAGVAAADAVLLPTYAAYIGKSHGAFVLAERALARRWNPKGAARDRARYWVALWALVDRSQRSFSEPPEGELSKIRTTYWDALNAMRDAVDYLSSTAKGETPITHDEFTEAQGRRRVATFLAAGFELLGQLGPAGEAQLRILQGGGAGEGDSAGRQES